MGGVSGGGKCKGGRAGRGGANCGRRGWRGAPGRGVQLSVREIGGVVLSALTAFAVVGSRTTLPEVS